MLNNNNMMFNDDTKFLYGSNLVHTGIVLYFRFYCNIGILLPTAVFTRIRQILLNLIGSHDPFLFSELPYGT